MPRVPVAPFPAVARLLEELGENIRLARLRRGFSTRLTAERAGISRPTLAAIERGAPGVRLGAVANVLHCLGLEKDLALLGRDDALGRALQDAALRKRSGVPPREGGDAG